MVIVDVLPGVPLIAAGWVFPAAVTLFDCPVRTSFSRTTALVHLKSRVFEAHEFFWQVGNWVFAVRHPPSIAPSVRGK